MCSSRKPAAVDVAGVHQLLEADELAKKNGTGVLAGLTYRYHLGRREAVERMHNGEIGEIVAIQCDYLAGALRPGPAPARLERDGVPVPQLVPLHLALRRRRAAVADPQSGLGLVGCPRRDRPMSVYGLGGRSSQFQPEMGTSFDHHSVIYEFANGRRIYGSVRTAVGCFGNNIDVFHGTKGRCIFTAFAAAEVHGSDRQGHVEGGRRKLSKKSPYEQEHLEFLQSIREGRPFQRGKQLAMSTLGLRARSDGRLHRPADHVGGRTRIEVRLPARR